MKLRHSCYRQLHRHVFDKEQKNFPRWRDYKIIKFPSDLILYAQAILENKPDIIIETGTAWGGSAMFFADMLELTGKGRVITVDLEPRSTPIHPRVTSIIGRSTSVETLDKVRSMVNPGDEVMVTLDSDHRTFHVKRELYHYSPMVTQGQFLVVEDCYYDTTPKPPAVAVDWFKKTMRGRRFNHTDYDKQFGAAVSQYGWLRRI